MIKDEFYKSQSLIEYFLWLNTTFDARQPWTLDGRQPLIEHTIDHFITNKKFYKLVSCGKSLPHSSGIEWEYLHVA